MNAEQQGSVDQHYVSRFYLRHFEDPANPKRIWTYEKGIPGPKLRGIRGVAYEPHFYSTPNSDGSPNRNFDIVLEELENVAAPAYRRIVDGVRPREFMSHVTEDDLAWFRIFLSMLRVRVPRFRDQVLQAVADQAFESARLRAPSKQARLFVHPQVVIDAMGLEWLNFDEALGQMTLVFRYAPNDTPFVTSDAPVIVTRRLDEAGVPVPTEITDRMSCLMAPITPSVALQAVWEPPPGYSPRQGWTRLVLRQATREVVELVNSHVVYYASRYVYAPRNDASLEELVQHPEMRSV